MVHNFLELAQHSLLVLPRARIRCADESLFLVMVMRNILRVVLVAGVVAGAALSFARPEPNAFLNKPAWTHSALMNQARTDGVVMSRWMRHFGKTRQEMLSYLGQLKPGTLNQDGVYLVYNVNNDEEIRARVIFYRKGTKVWNLNGEPVMKMSCANPMRRGTDDQLAVVQPTADMSDNLRAVETVEGDPIANGLAPAEVVAELEMEPQALAAVAAVPGVTSALVGGSSFSPFALLPLAGLGLIRRGGGNGDTPPPPPPVPEPFTMTAVGAGLAYLAVRKAKKTSK